MQLYATGNAAATAATATSNDKAAPTTKAMAPSPSLSTASEGSGSGAERTPSGGPALASAGSNSGSSTGAARRPLAHPYFTGPGMWAIAVVLAFGGAFAGLCVSQIYDAYAARTVLLRTDYPYVGMLQFAALGVLIALPVMALALGLHAWIAIRCVLQRNHVRLALPVVLRGVGGRHADCGCVQDPAAGTRPIATASPSRPSLSPP